MIIEKHANTYECPALEISNNVDELRVYKF